MGKDWTGNKTTVFAQLGASSHSEKDRAENDFYSTDPDTVKLFLNKLKEDGLQLHNKIWECACGQGHISKTLIENGYEVLSTDLIDRGYGVGNIDFLKANNCSWNGDILTNPPYNKAREFVEQAIDLITDNNYVIMLLKIQFLEGKERYKLFQKYPPRYIYT